jgi:hypothetical protein
MSTSKINVIVLPLAYVLVGKKRCSLAELQITLKANSIKVFRGFLGLGSNSGTTPKLQFSLFASKAVFVGDSKRISPFAMQILPMCIGAITKLKISIFQNLAKSLTPFALLSVETHRELVH